MQPTTCLASECEDVVSWPDIAPWLEHLGNRHYPRYYCQFPGHENLWFSSVTELESHLEGSHSSSVTSTMASIFATKGKHSPPDPLFSMLRTDWNRDENERHNFIACPLCGIRVLNMKEMSWDALVEIKGFDIDHTRSEYRDKLPPHTRGHILDHLTRHFEALSLLSLWNLDIAPSEPTLPSNKGSTVLTLRSKPKESPLGEPFVPTRKFEATISDWIQCPDTNKTYRWKCNSEGQLQYQWQTQHDRRVNQQMMQQATLRPYDEAPKPPVTYPMEPRTVPVTSDQSSSLHAPQSTGVVASMVDPSTRQEWRHIENDSEPTAYENRHPGECSCINGN